MSADKQTFALHCEAKNDKVRKRLGIKGGFFWTEARKLSVAVSRCIAAMDDAGYDEDDFKKPVRVNFPVVNDLPPEGVFDTEFCNRYEKGGNDGITMMAIPFDDNINGEDATTAGDDNDNLDGTIPDDVEKSESPAATMTVLSVKFPSPL